MKLIMKVKINNCNNLHSSEKELIVIEELIVMGDITHLLIQAMEYIKDLVID
jgi:hypothetical protein